MEVEIDVLFADLSKQIALLIMDDDDDDDVEFPARIQPVHAQGFHYWPQAVIPPPLYTYEMAYRRESKGTGVFIPRSSPPKRKNRTVTKSGSNNNNSQRHNDGPGIASVPPRVANNSRVHSSYYTNSGALKNRV